MTQPSPRHPPPVTAPTRASRWPDPRVLLALIVAVSLVLRVALVRAGGQYFLGDEGRYDRGVLLYQALVSGDLATVRGIVMLPEHTLFPWVGAAVTAVQRILALATPYGTWQGHPENIVFTMWLGAAVLSLFSTLNIFLVHRVARAAGAAGDEALWAALLMAAANSPFYFSRHLLPYGCALSAALAALAVGCGAPTNRRAFGGGVLAGVTYGIYNGYWYLVPMLWLVHALAVRQAPGARRLAAWSAAGIALALAVPVAIGAGLGGAYYWTLVAEFGDSVTLGLFREGWSLPWEYLWHSEDVLGATVATLVLTTVVLSWRRSTPLPSPARLWFAALGVAYALLVLFSCGLERFVVYGRTVLPFVPLICLQGGWALASILASRPHLKFVAAGIVILAAILNFLPHFAFVFPRAVELAVERTYGAPKHTLSVTGSFYRPVAQAVTRPDLVLVNAQMLYPVRDALDLPAGATLLQVTNPLSYLPYQYEGHTPRERAWLRSHDISMRLIKLANPAAQPDNLPLALTARYEDRALGH